MAVYFTGSATSQRVNGDSQDFAALMIIQNDIASRSVMYLRRLTVQLDMVTNTTTLFVPALTYRGTGTPSTVGGLLTSKFAFDTATTSSEYVKIWTAVTPDGANDSNIFGTPGILQWRKWAGKVRTQVNQQKSEDAKLLPSLVATTNWTLYPGQFLVVRIDPVTADDNNVNLGWLANVIWQEELLPTFTISGTVSLSGSGVVGAEVTVIVADDTALTNAYLHSIVTTTAGGAWSANIPTGKTAYAYASDFASGTYYTATGAPFIT